MGRQIREIYELDLSWYLDHITIPSMRPFLEAAGLDIGHMRRTMRTPSPNKPITGSNPKAPNLWKFGFTSLPKNTG